MRSLSRNKGGLERSRMTPLWLKSQSWSWTWTVFLL